VKAELFPTNVRALGVGLSYATYRGHCAGDRAFFNSLGHEDWFYYYLIGIIFLSLTIYATMCDTKHQSAMHRHQ
jgi:MFS transporter, MHS family, alpha-ketoglutarate permease